MLKRILFGIVLIFLLAKAGFAQPAAISSGLNWLVANQNADKSWGGPSSSVTPWRRFCVARVPVTTPAVSCPAAGGERWRPLPH